MTLALLMLPYSAVLPIRALGARPQLRACVRIGLLFTFRPGQRQDAKDNGPDDPPWDPYLVLVIYITGVIEVVAGWLVVPEQSRRPAGWFLIVMLAGLLPSNIYTDIQHFAMGGHDEIGPRYLLIRIPVQFIIMGWCYWFAARRADGESA